MIMIEANPPFLREQTKKFASAVLCQQENVTQERISYFYYHEFSVQVRTYAYMCA